MAISSRKISSFPQLSSLTGDESLMVAYKGKSYKIPVSLLTGNALQTITQRTSTVDGGDNPINLQVGVGDSEMNYTLHVYNGQKGSKGPDGDQGPKGLTGDTAIALYSVDPDELPIYDSLEDGDAAELAKMILSAAKGVELQSQLDLLKEEFLYQEEYDEKLAKNEIYDDVKYFIWET